MNNSRPGVPMTDRLQVTPGGSDEPSQPSVRSLLRGLEILRVLNLEGELSTARIASETGLARITAYRLLKTLERDGYVVRDPSKRYHLGPSVLELNSRYSKHSWLIEFASPRMQEICRELGWPIVLGTNNGPRMVIQHTTRDDTGFWLKLRGPGSQLPLLHSAMGLAFLAHTPVPLQADLAKAALELDGAITPEFRRNPESLTALLSEIRNQGYATVRASWRSESIPLSAIAVPLYHDEMVSAALGLTYYQSAMTNSEAIERYATPLQEAARRITMSF